jgi:hypothetical protein
MPVHIGNKIKEVTEKTGIKPTEFGRRINKSRETVYHIFQRKSLDTGLLEIISKVLEHDFFQYYTPLKAETKKLKEDIVLLKEMIELLKEKNKKKSS